MTHTGSSPEPFDAVDERRLAGPDGSHPLHTVAVAELVRPSSGDVVGEFSLDRPAVVGTGITGRLSLTPLRPIRGRGAHLRLVGLRLVEERRSRRGQDDQPDEEWVEANGKLFVEDAFLEPAIPLALDPGQAFVSPFAVPIPRLGPPSAHLGEAIVAWALEVRWDVARASDPFAACLLPIAQHPDLLRAGVGRQGGESMLASVNVGGGATIGIVSRLPATPGTAIEVQVHWPGAPDGRMARVELQRRTSAPNGSAGILAAAAASVDMVRAGTARVALPIPAGSAPSFDGAGLQFGYAVRVVIDRPMRQDVAIERPVAVA